MSSPTRSTSSSITTDAGSTVVIALGSNLGDRRYNLMRGVSEIAKRVRLVRLSSIHETDAVDSPFDSPPFLNMVVVGFTSLPPQQLLEELHEIEDRLGRAPRRVRNEPRVIDIDLILHGARRVRSRTLTLPHPRAHLRRFVLEPLEECSPAAVDFLSGLYSAAPERR